MIVKQRVAGSLRDYAALTKPHIILLLLVTTVPAMVLAADGWPGAWVITATLVGGAMAAGGAASVNMYVDRDIDALMTRTQGRPIPAGRIPADHALVLGLALGFGACTWLWITVTATAAILALLGFVHYAFIYSVYLKRRTPHNTVLGGIAGALPPMVGWAAVTDSVTLEAVVLFAIVFCWQPAHFWALAIRLEQDYRRAHIPMMPVIAGQQETRRQIVLYSVATVATTVLLGAVMEFGWFYFGAALLSGAQLIASSIRMYRTPLHDNGTHLFRYSTTYLTIVFLAMALERLLPF